MSDRERDELAERFGFPTGEISPEHQEDLERRMSEPPEAGDWYVDVALGELFQVREVSSWSSEVEEVLGYMCVYVYEDGVLGDSPAQTIRESPRFMKIERPERVDELLHVELDGVEATEKMPYHEDPPSDSL